MGTSPRKCARTSPSDPPTTTNSCSYSVLYHNSRTSNNTTNSETISSGDYNRQTKYSHLLKDQDLNLPTVLDLEATGSRQHKLQPPQQQPRPPQRLPRPQDSLIR